MGQSTNLVGQMADWAGAAGVPQLPTLPMSSAPGSVPAMDSTVDLMKQMGTLPTSPTAQQGINTPVPMEPHLHAPITKPMQDTQRLPISNDSSSIIQARRQNRFGQISNAVNQAESIVAQRKYDDLKTDVVNISRAQSQAANAQAVLNDPSADPKTKEAAKQVLETNTKYIQSQLQDDKKRKNLAKAFDISFTDPQGNNTPEVKAGQAGLKEAHQNELQKLDANTPAEKTVQDHLNKPKDDSYAQQFLAKQPQMLTSNLQYEAQLKNFESQQKYAAQYIIPKIIDQQTKKMTTDILADTRMKTTYANIIQKDREAMLKDLTELEKADIERDSHLKGIVSQNATRMAEAKLRAQTALQIAGMKDAKGNWKEDKIQREAVMSYTNEIDKTASNNKTLSDQNNNIRVLAADRTLTPDEQKLLDSNEKTIKVNNLFLNQMNDQRQKLTTKLFGTPVADNSVATDKATKGYVINGNPQSAPPPNGPADDAAQSRIIAASNFSSANDAGSTDEDSALAAAFEANDDDQSNADWEFINSADQ